MELKFEKLGKSFVVPDHTKLPEISQSYLVHYGFQQSMQDCIAGTAKEASADYAEQCKKAKKKPNDVDMAAAVKTAIEAQLGKRLDAIVAGTVGIRSHAPRDPLMTIAREEIWVALRKPENEQKKKAIQALEKDARNDKLQELAKGHLEKNRARIEAEHQRRQGSVGEVEIVL